MVSIFSTTDPGYFTMSGGYFGFSHTGSQFGQQQSSYPQAAATAHHGSHVFTPSAAAAAQHTSYVVASTARPSAAAAYEAGYSSHQPSQYYSTTTQRHDTQPQTGSQSSYRQQYTTYGDSSSASTGGTTGYEKQTYYQPQAQQTSQSGYYSSNTGNRGGGKSTYQNTPYYQSSGAKVQKQTSGYTTSGYGSNTQQHAVAPKQSQQSQKVQSGSYSYAGHTNPAAAFTSNASSSYNQKKYQQPAQTTQFSQDGTKPNSYNFSTYEVAVFSAASNYYQQQQAKVTGFSSNTAGGQSGIGKKKGNMNQRPRQPPKPTQLHYCDICKISCAGPLTYKEHLEGQKHKKKENALKEQPAPTKSSQPSYRCELCDVTCTGLDAFNAHKRGIKHNKVVKLHTKLGKPIPNMDPVRVGSTVASTATTAKTTQAGAVAKAAPQQKATVTKKVVAPKINFVAAGGKQAVQADDKKNDKAATGVQDIDPQDILDEPNIQPVGEEYVEEVKGDDGKLVSFNCKLCECRFNDPNAKEMHMKGRRHRLHYKKKVDPSLKVEVKPTLRSRRLAEDKMRRQLSREVKLLRKEEEVRWRNAMRYEEDMFWRQMEEERHWEEMRRREEMEFMEWHRRGGPSSGIPPPRTGPSFFDTPPKKPESEIDRHVMAKHNTIYPTEDELKAVQGMVSTVEKALKMVSDFLTEADKPTPTPADKPTPTPAAKKPAEKKTPSKTDAKTDSKTDSKTDAKDTKDTKDAKDAKEAEQPNRIMKGVMRVGVLAKGLLLRGDLNMELIVLCTEKPTRTLLERVFDLLPKQMADVTDKKYELSLCVEEAAIIIATSDESKMTMKVSLTSPVMRDPEADASRDPPDVLDKEKCLIALAALRHAKWFQARAAGLPSCVIIIRVLRDLCDRIPTWEPLKGWPMELLVERVIASSGHPLSPGDTLRRIFEAIAGGIILPGGPGIHDPCEREESDALNHVTYQEREDITASAQHALRLIVFRQVHKVLSMEPMYAPQKLFRYNRKRRREDTGAENDGEGKKDKKDGLAEELAAQTSTKQIT